MRTRHLLSLGCLALVLSSGCQDCQRSAKTPAIISSLPAGAQILFQLDGKSLTATYAKVMEAVKGLAPAEEIEKIPSWEEVVAKVKEPTGIDLNRIGHILMASYFDTQSGTPNRFAVIVEGLTAADLKGTQAGDHNGTPLYQLSEEKKLHYAQLDPRHVAAAESREFLQVILDTHAGRDQGLSGSNPMLARLQKIDPKTDQIRVYLLSGDFPGLEKSPVKVEGGGFFVDMQEGFSAAIVGDPEGLSKLKAIAEMGLRQVKSKMDEGLKQAPPEEIKKMGPALEVGKAFIEGIRFQHDDDQLTVTYQGDQPPLAMVGIMAAVAIPAFIDYIRKSKLSEIHENLDRCYRGVVDYYDQPHALADGSTRTSVMPEAMSRPVCPGDRSIASLDGQSRLFDPKRFGEKGPAYVFAKIGLVIREKSYACYQLTVETGSGKSAGVTGFTCHAWTDLDDDDRPAHWTKQGIYQKATSSFQAAPVWHDPDSDNW